MKKILLLVVLGISMFAVSGCGLLAEVVSVNLDDMSESNIENLWTTILGLAFISVVFFLGFFLVSLKEWLNWRFKKRAHDRKVLVARFGVRTSRLPVSDGPRVVASLFPF